MVACTKQVDLELNVAETQAPVDRTAETRGIPCGACGTPTIKAKDVPADHWKLTSATQHLDGPGCIPIYGYDSPVCPNCWMSGAGMSSGAPWFWERTLKNPDDFVIPLDPRIHSLPVTASKDCSVVYELRFDPGRVDEATIWMRPPYVGLGHLRQHAIQHGISFVIDFHYSDDDTIMIRCSTETER